MRERDVAETRYCRQILFAGICLPLLPCIDELATGIKEDSFVLQYFIPIQYPLWLRYIPFTASLIMLFVSSRYYMQTLSARAQAVTDQTLEAIAGLREKDSEDHM